MSVLRPRNRLVNFRLSEDEFDQLKIHCSQSGARSVSDFARSSVLQRMQDLPDRLDSQPSYLRQLDNKVAQLELRVGQLLNLLQGTSSTSVVEAGAAIHAEP